MIQGSECEKMAFQCYNEGKKWKTVFQYNENAKIADGKQYKKQIIHVINQWSNGLLRDTARSNLVGNKQFRIDMQGMVNWNNERYHNLQIQRNIPRRSGHSTTYSQVLVPKNSQEVSDQCVNPFLSGLANRYPPGYRKRM